MIISPYSEKRPPTTYFKTYRLTRIDNQLYFVVNYMQHCYSHVLQEQENKLCSIIRVKIDDFNQFHLLMSIMATDATDTADAADTVDTVDTVDTADTVDKKIIKC